MFNTVVGKQCTQSSCESRGLMKEASAYLCEKCGSELKPITKMNTAMVAGAAVAGLLLMGGLGWATRIFVLNRAASAISSGIGSGLEAKAFMVIQYAVQSEGNGRPQNVPLDHVFRSGDRLRLLLRSAAPSSHYYVFYEDQQNAKMEILYPERGVSHPVAANEPVPAPPGNGNWLRLDENPGQERFIVIAATSPIDELTFDGPSCSKSRFDTALQKVKDKYGLADVSTANDLEWTRAEPTSKGLLMTRFSVQHQ